MKKKKQKTLHKYTEKCTNTILLILLLQLTVPFSWIKVGERLKSFTFFF